MSKAYWKEAVECACDEAGLALKEGQIETIALSMYYAHDLYGQAHGYDVIGSPPSPEAETVKRLEKTIEDLERREDAYRDSIKSRYNFEVNVCLEEIGGKYTGVKVEAKR